MWSVNHFCIRTVISTSDVELKNEAAGQHRSKSCQSRDGKEARKLYKRTITIQGKRKIRKRGLNNLNSARGQWNCPYPLFCRSRDQTPPPFCQIIVQRRLTWDCLAPTTGEGADDAESKGSEMDRWGDRAWGGGASGT